ncbi:MAG: RCC1 domain-containing protein [Planctomycetota bacterium]|jgi:alpha-tubulin suppressor-like RCC1 family protein
MGRMGLKKQVAVSWFLAAAGMCVAAVPRVGGEVVSWGVMKMPDAELSQISKIAAGQAHSVALKSDGGLVGWGLDDYGQATPAAGSDFVAVAAGVKHSLALRSDGRIAGWGWDKYGQATPPDGNDYAAITAGYSHSLALRSDGRIVGWGRDDYGQATPPALP